MGNSIVLLYDNESDNALLTTGSWSAGLPLTNLLTSNIREVARTTDLALASTRFRAALVEPVQTQAVIVGPTNLSVSFQYRITWYSDEFVTPTATTGWVNPFEAAVVDVFDVPWEARYFWLGIPPFEDEDRGIWLIHVFANATTSQYWEIELDDQFNVDGYLEAGRLLIMGDWSPSLNYVAGSNALAFQNNTLTSTTLRGGKHHWRRINKRVFSVKFEAMPEAELFDDAYTLFQVVGYDREVFVIPDPSDATNMQRRAFLARVVESDPISQAAAGLGSTGLTLEEVAQ